MRMMQLWLEHKRRKAPRERGDVTEGGSNAKRKQPTPNPSLKGGGLGSAILDFGRTKQKKRGTHRMPLLIITRTRVDYQAVPSSEVACYDSQNTFCGK